MTRTAGAVAPQLVKETLTVSEVAAVLGISLSLVQRLVARGELRSVKLGARRVVSRAAVDELLGKSV